MMGCKHYLNNVLLLVDKYFVWDIVLMLNG